MLARLYQLDIDEEQHNSKDDITIYGVDILETLESRGQHAQNLMLGLEAIHEQVPGALASVKRFRGQPRSRAVEHVGG